MTPDWIDHLVIEEGQALLFRVPADIGMDLVKRMGDMLEERFDFPFVILAGDIEVTVVDR